MKKIIVITYAYPNPSDSTKAPFVREIVEQWRKMGRDVIVVDPVTWHSYRIIKNKKTRLDERFPLYHMYRWMKIIPGLRPIQTKLADRSFTSSVMKAVEGETDFVLYAHFLNAAFCGVEVAQKKNVDIFCAFGESELWSLLYKDKKLVDNRLHRVKKYISVSTENTEILENNNWAKKENIITLPNGVDGNKFRVLDKVKCREKLGIPSNATIGVFVGHFINRKGVLRVNEAAKNIQGLQMMYIGTGEQEPSADNIIYKGLVNHDDLPTYLNAADFFVLPTLAEGCCNAILEAMACGLPIISSVGKFNDDILDDTMSLRIDPMDIDAIKGSMLVLMENPEKRKNMGEKAALKSIQFSVTERAKKILQIMDE